MLRVEFVQRVTGEVVRCRAPLGARLLDVCDEADAGVRFSCRNESCGSCRVLVEAGHEALSPRSPGEHTLTPALAADERLACAVTLGEGGLLRLLVG